MAHKPTHTVMSQMQGTDTKQFETVLVTGATGYIGGRLVGRLLNAGYKVRTVVRDPSRLQGRPWADYVEVVQGDVLNEDTLPAAMAGVDAAYYLIHSMGGGADFHYRDLLAAHNFGVAAREAGLRRIIYLGGLGEPDSSLSPHLRSRQQTGSVLRDSGIQVTEFRAAVIVGSGGISFEMIRHLTERMPAMLCPRFIHTRIQPIGLRNVLQYLVAALDTPQSAGEIVEIGGADVMTYGEMFMEYAAERGLRRRMIAVPILTPSLYAHLVHYVTPVPLSLARPLIEGLRNEVIVRDDTAQRLFPGIQPISYRMAVQRALVRLDAHEVETAWSDALVSSQGHVPAVTLTSHEGMILEHRQRVIAAPPAVVYRAFTGLGGDRGWLYFNWAWRLRGLIDRVVGGVGSRRGRRDADEVRVGDALDYWRVEDVERERSLLLRAEIKVPGRAWLQFNAVPIDGGESRLIQTAFFAPKGLFGILYWYVLYPIHSLIFSGLIRKLAERADTLHNTSSSLEDGCKQVSGKELSGRQ
jgi:uncharacterized protein YbjT (DUF2867 family)